MYDPKVGQRGQSLVELALFMPIFIIVISGIVEMGYYFIGFLRVLDATREAARFASDLDPSWNYNSSYIYDHNSPRFERELDVTTDCNNVFDLWGSTACYAAEQAGGLRDNGYDDIVLSAYSIRDGVVVRQYPEDNSNGFSLTGNQVTLKDGAALATSYAGAPPDGIVVVEIFRLHRQAMCFPLFTVFVPCDIGIYEWSIFVNPTAASYAQ